MSDRRDAGPSIDVLGILSEAASRDVLVKVIRDRLFLTDDLTQGVALAEQHRPDVAFVEVGMHDGGGLALVHHLKAVVPQVTVYALASRQTLDAAANAVALGGAGLIIMPAGGDEILSAIEAVKLKLADRARRAEAERAEHANLRATAWLQRATSLAASPSRSEAAERLLDLVAEATGTRRAAVFLGVGEGASAGTPASSSAVARVAASAGLEHLSSHASSEEVLAEAAHEGLSHVPLDLAGVRVGHLFHAPPPGGVVAPELPVGAFDLLVTQAATAFALFAERERASAAVVKDPASSAYSFAYYVDVAGREIARAQRYSRRFAIATVTFESGDGGRSPPMTHAEMADQLLKAARDTDVVAHVDEHEFHVLMPETDGLGAHAARRRVLARMAERGGRLLPPGLLIGVATFPHDGADLSQILRVARRRAEATRYSLVRRFAPDQSTFNDLVEAVGWDLEAPEPEAIFAARRVELPVTEAAALGSAVVAEALRGGAAVIVLATHDKLGISSAVKAALPPPRDNLTVHTVDLRGTGSGSHPGIGTNDNIEAVAVLAEHGTYALVGHNERGVVHGIHAADPILADVLAERLGRAAGLRLLT